MLRHEIQIRPVVGATFGKRLLLHMLPHTSRDRAENLHAAFLKLIEANFISRSVVGQTESFSFVHTSVQEVGLFLIEFRLVQLCIA